MALIGCLSVILISQTVPLTWRRPHMAVRLLSALALPRQAVRLATQGATSSSRPFFATLCGASTAGRHRQLAGSMTATAAVAAGQQSAAEQQQQQQAPAVPQADPALHHSEVLLATSEGQQQAGNGTV